MNPAIINEFAKMRHLRHGLVAGVMLVAVVGLTTLSSITADAFADSATRTWELLLAGTSLAVPLASPLLVAVLASRQVDIEHQGNGWLAGATAGLTPGRQCRAKAIALGAVVASVTLAESALIVLAGLLFGITTPFPAGLWVGFTLCATAINLVVLGLHIFISAAVDNQLVALGVGVLGTMIAVFSPVLPPALAHVTPWGYYALATAADYQGTQVVAQLPAYPSVVAFNRCGDVAVPAPDRPIRP